MLTPDGLIDFAESLLALPGEYAQRAAIGRAYYAVGHAALGIAIEAGLVGPSPNLHAVWGRFRTLSGQPAWSLVGYQGWDLKKLRERADYLVVYDGNLAAEAADAVALAREMIARMEALPAPRG
jgi:hypothetical protein